MVKGSDQIGKRVVAFDSGEAFEKVEDVIFDYETRRVLGFLIDEGGWFRDARVVPFSAVQAVGPDGIVVHSKQEAATKVNDRDAIGAVLERNNVLKGTRIMTTDGKDLGSMVDLYFDEETGAIEGYDVSGGMFSDAYAGRGFVPAQHALNIGKDVAFVPPETADLMEEQVGGVKGAMLSAGQRVKDASETAAARVGDATQSAAERIRGAAHAAGDRAQLAADRMRSAAETAGESAQSAADRMRLAAQNAGESARDAAIAARSTMASAAERASVNASELGSAATVEEARGRRVRQTVLGDRGTIVAPVGMIVTDEVVARARANDQEAELLEAVGLTPTEALRAKASDRAARSAAAVKHASGQAAANLKAGASRASEGAGHLFQRAKDKLKDLQEQRMEERINDAIGRPVTRVILDRDDHVILNVGELVTNEAVHAARGADMLDTMLGSVSRQGPALSPHAYLAPERGEAALDGDSRASDYASPPSPEDRIVETERPRQDVAGRARDER